ncbi:hypothetical protein AADEFJLK_00576 [Methylovulum psychrotolerans]|uniref:Uncharacterized protein n=1 Tax=Methylovulum psychrotolerans TaxID=1704499 RepID=A0A2S5CRY6_9GAMM|nr:hypothetical protein AADEFJLK_00576 [Methylovulum psychrotolerans]
MAISQRGFCPPAKAALRKRLPLLSYNYLAIIPGERFLSILSYTSYSKNQAQ